MQSLEEVLKHIQAQSCSVCCVCCEPIKPMKPIKPIHSVAIIFFLIFFCLATLLYASPFKGPNPLLSLVEVYRTYISPIDGKTCPMYPTCSKYSVQSFKKHGFFIGWVMTIVRLFRCGRDELRLSPWIRVNGEIRCYDPLENNDFWWYNGR